ncbi:hypothetical protein S40293_07200, partial [Stachybotrys chartarum IBT 40293]
VLFPDSTVHVVLASYPATADSPWLTPRVGFPVDRKVRCDRGLPGCATCARSHKTCHGYGIRLSWPRADDRKRFIAGPVASSHAHKITNLTRESELHMIHTTHKDIELYRYMTLYRHTGNPPIRGFVPPFLSHLSTNNKDLLHYFQAVVSPSLSTLSDRQLGPVLMRIATSANSTSGFAVQKALLAFASLHRYGIHFQAAQLKLSCLQALGAANSGDMELRDIVHHLAAGMLLCVFEILQHFTSTNGPTAEWLCYISGAKTLVNSIPMDVLKQEGDLLALIEWVYYYESVYRFTRVHWHPRGVRKPSRWKMELPTMDKPLRPDTVVSIQHHGLDLLTNICNTLQPSSNPTAHTEEYKNKIRQLRQQAEHDWAAALVPEEAFVTREQSRSLLMKELYHLAVLIYLCRAAGSHIVDPECTIPWTRRGLRLLGALGTCDRTMPLVIIGAEASTDEDRMAVMDVLAATERQHPVRAGKCLWNFLHALWNQDDLHAERDLPVDYMEKLTAVMSMLEALPPFE